MAKGNSKKTAKPKLSGKAKSKPSPGKKAAVVKAKPKPVAKQKNKPAKKTAARVKAQPKKAAAKTKPKKALSISRKPAASARKPAAKPAKPVAKRVAAAAKVVKSATRTAAKTISAVARRGTQNAKKAIVPSIRKAGARAAELKKKPIVPKKKKPGAVVISRDRKSTSRASMRRGARPAAQPAAAPPSIAIPPQRRVRFKADEMRKLRLALEQERERLLRDIRALDDQALTDGLAETISQQPGFSLQLADSASDNQQVDTALGIRSIELDQLMQIDEALRAIVEGDYGICHRCGETISIERLLVKPMAKYCVPCRQLLETGKA